MASRSPRNDPTQRSLPTSTATVPAPKVVHAQRKDPRPAERSFAWAPVQGASGYHVEFFRGDAPIFAAGTKQAKISIPARWNYRGKPQSLTPGEYRWYVWPVFDGTGRAAVASVQARLSID